MKSFVIPKFMFPGSVISFNEEMRMSINSVILYFVRRGMDKIAKLTVSREYEDGGLKMFHPEYLIKSQRIVCLNGTWGVLKVPGKSPCHIILRMSEPCFRFTATLIDLITMQLISFY